MITSLDHVTLICPEIDAGVATYETVMGRTADWRAANPVDGTATALFRVGNTALELLAPLGRGPVGERIEALVAEDGPGLTAMAFATGDIGEAHRVLGRRGLGPADIARAEASDAGSGQKLHWQRFRLDTEATAGIRTFIITERSAALPWAATAPGGVTALDHIVVGTPNPDRAAALYGARLGLRLALDRTAPQWKTRFLFFRTGGVTVEVVNRLGDPADAAGPDRFFGLTWETDDLHAAHARLVAAGLDVSEVRTGRKPGSEVFTLRDGTLGVPTLFIAHSAR